MNGTPAEQAKAIIKENDHIHFSAADRLGHALATLEAYHDRDWAAIEPEARRLWEERYDRPWPEFKEIVYQAWAEARPQFSTEAVREEDPTSYQAIFRRHFEANYADSEYDFEQYAPAYHYGYDLAVDGRLRRASWEEIVPAAHQYWQTQSYAGSWQDFKAAVQYAWSETRKRQSN